MGEDGVGGVRNAAQGEVAGAGRVQRGDYFPEDVALVGEAVHPTFVI